MRRTARTCQPHRRLCAGVADSPAAKKATARDLRFSRQLGRGHRARAPSVGDFDGYDEVFLLLDDTDDYLGDVEVRPAARCLTISFRGTHRQAAPRYEQLLSYMREHGLAPCRVLTRDCPDRRHHQRRPRNLRDADQGACYHIQIRTTLKKGGLLLGYNPRAPGSRLKARARTRPGLVHLDPWRAGRTGRVTSS